MGAYIKNFPSLHLFESLNKRINPTMSEGFPKPGTGGPYCFSPHTVIVGRGKEPRQNEGNKRLREIVTSLLHKYSVARDKRTKTRIVDSVVARVMTNGGRFVKYVKKSGEFQEANETVAREKVGYLFRDLLGGKNRPSFKSRKTEKSSHGENGDDEQHQPAGEQQLQEQANVSQPQQTLQQSLEMQWEIQEQQEQQQDAPRPISNRVMVQPIYRQEQQNAESLRNQKPTIRSVLEGKTTNDGQTHVPILSNNFGPSIIRGSYQQTRPMQSTPVFASMEPQNHTNRHPFTAKWMMDVDDDDDACFAKNFSDDTTTTDDATAVVVVRPGEMMIPAGGDFLVHQSGRKVQAAETPPPPPPFDEEKIEGSVLPSMAQNNTRAEHVSTPSPLNPATAGRYKQNMTATFSERKATLAPPLAVRDDNSRKNIASNEMKTAALPLPSYYDSFVDQGGEDAFEPLDFSSDSYRLLKGQRRALLHEFCDMVKNHNDQSERNRTGSPLANKKHQQHPSAMKPP